MNIHLIFKKLTLGQCQPSNISEITITITITITILAKIQDKFQSQLGT
jgi:hypothetical protein